MDTATLCSWDGGWDENNYVRGIVIYPDDGGRIINYPEQHIENGKKKNNETNRYYKKMVRIMKKMRYLMCECGYKEAEQVSSFGLWNIPLIVLSLKK